MILNRITYLFIILLGVSCSKNNDESQLPGNPADTVSGGCMTLSREVSDTLSEDGLLDLVEKQTLRYFWNYAEPHSGMARERLNSGNTVTTGGTGFGIMALIAGTNRGFLERDTVVGRILHIARFLQSADRYHGAWSHWYNGETGKTQPFSSKDDGGDLVETAFMIQGLLAAREYFDQNTPKEDTLRNLIDTLWHQVQWTWYENGQNVLFWHWSPNYNFELNQRITGWNEALIVYILAASSPTYPISKAVYDEGWANGGNIKNGKYFYDLKLPLGPDFGGPLFFAHYSFLGLDPRGLSDQYADYFVQNKNQTLINYNYCIANPYGYCYYSDSCWGLTASDDPETGYQAHAPFRIGGGENGTITPSAALSSFPYTPNESMKALKFFYYYLHDQLWGEYGFKDAFNIKDSWFATSYLAIDQGPIVVMIENYRTQLLWNVFMKNTDVQYGLTALGFTY